MLSAKPIESNPSSKPEEKESRPPHPDFPPFHVIPGLSNFRDIGGQQYKLQGFSVREGMIFRGSDTNRITPEGVAMLRKLGVQTDFDLRSKQQIDKAGGFKEMEGIERKWTPVFADEQYTEEAARQRYELYASEDPKETASAFIEILESGASMFQTVLRHILATVPKYLNEPAPAVFMHCTTGNNRTGVFISMLLLLLGVPDDKIVEEYTLSNEGLAPTRHINIERLLKKGAFQEHVPAEARRRCERMVGARQESMYQLIVEVKNKWGGAKGYFKEVVRLSDQETEKLRNTLLV